MSQVAQEIIDLAVKGVMRRKLLELSNSYAPRDPHPFILRLPTDILEGIFIQCACDYYYLYNGRPTSAAPSWVNVSYVCHHWRHVALNCATMWTYIFITSERWTEELLARSRQASLKIFIMFFDVSGYQWLNNLEKVMDHLERIQDLCMGLPRPYIQVLSKLSSPAPRLQFLDIRLPDGPPPEWPSLLFAGIPPALHTLNLFCCWVPLSSFALNALTTLRIDRVPGVLQHNIEEFLAVMVCMRNLERLYLRRGALPSATGFLSSAVFKTFEKIDLPHLSLLVLLDAPVSTAIALLSCINIPSKTTVDLEIIAEPDDPSHNYAVLGSLFTQRCSMAKYHALSSSRIIFLDIWMCDGRGVTLTFTSQRDFAAESDEDEIEEWGSNIPLRIYLESSEDGDREHLISNICCSMPLSNVRGLHVVQPPFSPTFWRNILGHLQDIRYIELEMAHMPDLSVLSLTDLTTDEGVQHQDGGRGQSHMLAPKLEELMLNRIEFLPEGDFDLPDRNRVPEPGITLRFLLDALSTRQGSHGRLTMTRCTIGGFGRFDSVRVWEDGGIHDVVGYDSEYSEE